MNKHEVRKIMNVVLVAQSNPAFYRSVLFILRLEHELPLQFIAIVFWEWNHLYSHLAGGSQTDTLFNCHRWQG